VNPSHSRNRKRDLCAGQSYKGLSRIFDLSIEPTALLTTPLEVKLVSQTDGFGVLAAKIIHIRPN
jgi:hypothetical protein